MASRFFMSVLSTFLGDVVAVCLAVLFLGLATALGGSTASGRGSVLRSTLFQIPLSILFSLGSDLLLVPLIIVSTKFNVLAASPFSSFSFFYFFEGVCLIFFLLR